MTTFDLGKIKDSKVDQYERHRGISSSNMVMEE